MKIRHSEQRAEIGVALRCASRRSHVELPAGSNGEIMAVVSTRPRDPVEGLFLCTGVNSCKAVV